MVTDIVPELLPGPQRAQLVLGLRARVRTVVEMCVSADRSSEDEPVCSSCSWFWSSVSVTGLMLTSSNHTWTECEPSSR